MTGDEPSPRVRIWTDGQHAAGVGRVLRLMGDDVCAIVVGGPRTAELSELAKQLDCPHEDDLRKMLVDWPAPFVLLATMQGVTPQDVKMALDQGSTVLCLDPVAADFDCLPHLLPNEANTSHGRLVMVPSFLRSEGWTGAAHPTEALGAIRLVSFVSIGRVDDCSLFARLADAWQAVLSLAQVPQSIDASLVGTLSEVPDDLRAMTGHLAAHARLPEGCSAVLMVSDRTSVNHRSLDVIGEQCRLRVGEFDYVLYSASGEIVDHEPASSEASTDFAQVVAWDWKRLLDPPATASIPRDAAMGRNILACSIACLLSARTGEPESPTKLLALPGAVS